VKILPGNPKGKAGVYDDIRKKIQGKQGPLELKSEFLFDPKKEKNRRKGLPQGATPDFGKAVKTLLTQRKINEAHLAKLSGVNEKSIRSIENHSTMNPSFDCLERIASAFGIHLLDFMALAWSGYRGNLYKTSPSERWVLSYELDKGFSIHVFSPPSMSRRDFFIGVLTISKEKKLNYWKFPASAAKACIQPWDGKVIFTYHGMNWREEEEVLANQTLYFDPCIPHSFENPSPAPVRLLLVTCPSLF